MSMVERLPWENTARGMAAGQEEWSAWDAAAADGLDAVPWAENKPRPVAEGRTGHDVKPRTGKASCRDLGRVLR